MTTPVTQTNLLARTVEAATVDTIEGLSAVTASGATVAISGPARAGDKLVTLASGKVYVTSAANLAKDEAEAAALIAAGAAVGSVVAGTAAAAAPAAAQAAVAAGSGSTAAAA